MDLLTRKLSNGINVFLQPRDFPTVSLGFCLYGGAGHDPKGLKGAAHLIEHLQYKGRDKSFSRNFSRRVETKGGAFNAQTSNEATTYYGTFTEEHGLEGLELISSLGIKHHCTPAVFDKERSVVWQEINQYHDNPRDFVEDKLQLCLFSPPFGSSILGSKKDVAGMTPGRIEPVLDRLYFPGNYTFGAVGKIDFGEMCKVLERTYQPIKGDPVASPIVIRRNSHWQEIRKDLDQAHFAFGIHAPAENQPSYLAFSLLEAYLTGASFSRFFEEIREDRGLAYAVKGFLSAERNHGQYGVYVGADASKLPHIEKLILSGFKEAEKMTARELGELKEMVLGRRTVAMESTESALFDFFSTSLNAKDVRKSARYKTDLYRVSLDEVRAAAASVKNGYSTARILPA